MFEVGQRVRIHPDFYEHLVARNPGRDLPPEAFYELAAVGQWIAILIPEYQQIWVYARLDWLRAGSVTFVEPPVDPDDTETTPAIVIEHQLRRPYSVRIDGDEFSK